MSKEKQIEEIARDICRNYEDEGICRANLEFDKCDCECWNGTYLAPKLYEAGYRKQEWISVDERLPEKWQQVLVNYNGNVCISWQNANGTWFECWNDKVTHWMPLPEAPKMKGGAE